MTSCLKAARPNNGGSNRSRGRLFIALASQFVFDFALVVTITHFRETRCPVFTSSLIAFRTNSSVRWFSDPKALEGPSPHRPHAECGGSPSCKGSLLNGGIDVGEAIASITVCLRNKLQCWGIISIDYDKAVSILCYLPCSPLGICPACFIIPL